MPTNSPPVIKIDGSNPAIIQVGATYNDLGATITGPKSDLNLGIHSFVNGVKTEPVQLDTSAAATIAYVATGQNGLTSTTTRTVIHRASTAIQPAGRPVHHLSNHHDRHILRQHVVHLDNRPNDDSNHYHHVGRLSRHQRGNHDNRRLIHRAIAPQQPQQRQPKPPRRLNGAHGTAYSRQLFTRIS